MIGKINIHGHIGPSYVDAVGMFHKGTELLDVVEQVMSFPDATEIEVSVNSPGGYVDIGDSIYDYLTSLKKKGKTITTIQTGLVGSIATKIFLAGDRRIADDRYEFFIHNPFQADITGDADQVRAVADELDKTEKLLRKFYAQFTNITDEGLDGLMKIETGLTADQCLKFGFATEKKLIPALNIVNKNYKKVSKPTEKSFMEHVQAFFAPEKKVAKGVQPKAKAQIPGATPESKSLAVELADGAGSFWVEGEALVEGAGAFLFDADGKPTNEAVQDGEYPMADGSIVAILDGKVAGMKPAVEEEEEMPAVEEEAANAETVYTKDAVDKIVADAVAAAKAEFEKAQSDLKAEIMAIKKNTKLGVQPVKAVIQAQNNAPMGKSIAQVMAEKVEERKKQLNKN